MEKQIEHHKIMLKDNCIGTKVNVNKQQLLKSGQDINRALFSKPIRRFPSEMKKIKMIRRHSKFRQNMNGGQRALKKVSRYKLTGVVEKQLYQPTVETIPEQGSRQPPETTVIEKWAHAAEGQNQEHQEVNLPCKDLYSLPKNQCLFDSMDHQSSIFSIHDQTSRDQDSIKSTPSPMTIPSQCLTPKPFLTQSNEKTVDQPLHSTPNHHRCDAKDQNEKDILVKEVQTGKQAVVTHSYTEQATKQLDNNVDLVSKQTSVEMNCTHTVLNINPFTKNMSNSGNEQFEYSDNFYYSRPEKDTGERDHEHFSAEMVKPNPSYSLNDETIGTADLDQINEMYMAKPLHSKPCVTSSSQFFTPVCSCNIQHKSENDSYSLLNNSNQLNGDILGKPCFHEQFNLQSRVVDSNLRNWARQDPVSQIVINVNTQKFLENIELFKLLLSKTQVDDSNNQASVGNQNERDQISGTVLKKDDKSNQMAGKVLSHTNYTTHMLDKKTEQNPLLQELLAFSPKIQYSTTCQTPNTLPKDKQKTSCLHKLLTRTDDWPDSTLFTSSTGRTTDQSRVSSSSKSHELFNYQENCSSFKSCKPEIVHETLQDGYNGQRLNDFIEEETRHQNLDKYEIYIDLCPEEIDTPSTSPDTTNNYNYVILPDADDFLPDADDLVSSIDITDDNRAVLSSTNDSEEMMRFEDVIRRNLSSLDTSFSGDSMAVSINASDDTQINSTNAAYTDTSNEIFNESEKKTKEIINTDLERRIGSRFKNIYTNTVSYKRLKRKSSSKRLKRKRHHSNRKQRTGALGNKCPNGYTLEKQAFDISSSDKIPSALEIGSSANVCENTRNRHPRKAKEKDKPYQLRHRIIQKKHSSCNSCKGCRRNGQRPKAFNYNKSPSINKRNHDLKKRNFGDAFDAPVSSFSEDVFSHTVVDLRSNFSKPTQSGRQQIKPVEETFIKSKQFGNSDFKSIAGKIKQPFQEKRKSNHNKSKNDKLDKLILYRYNIKSKSNIKETRDIENGDIQQTEGKVAKFSINVGEDAEQTEDDGQSFKSELTKPSGSGEKQSRTMDMCLLCRKIYPRPYIYIHRKRCAAAHKRSKVTHSNNLYNKCVKKYPQRHSISARLLTDGGAHRSGGQKSKILEEDPTARSLREHFKKMRPDWKIMKCVQCNYMTGFSQTLKSHCRIHSKQDHIQCKHCNISFSSLGRMFQSHRRYKIHHQGVTALKIGENTSSATNPRMTQGKKESKDSTKDLENNVCSFMKDIKSLSTWSCQTVIDKIPDRIGSKILLKGKESSVIYERQETGAFKKTEQLQDTSDVNHTDLCQEKFDHNKVRRISQEIVDSTVKVKSPQISNQIFDEQRRKLNNFEKVTVNVEGIKHNKEVDVVKNTVATVAEIHENEIDLTVSKREAVVETSDSEEDPLDKAMEISNTVDALLETSLSNSTQSSEFEECMDGTERRITRSNNSGVNQDYNGNDNTVKTKSVISSSTGQTAGRDKDDDDENNDGRDDNAKTGDGASIRDVEFFSCLVCATSFSKKEDLLRHLSKIHRLTNLCTLCYFKRLEIQRFSNAVSLRNHKLRDHAEDMVECVCGSLFIDEKMLTSHLKKFKCYSRTNSTLEQDMVKCVCGKRFENDNLMLYHKKNKCRKRAFDVNSSDEFDQLRDTKIKFDNNTVGNSNFSTKNPKRSKCETLSYADSLLDTCSGDTKLLYENIRDEAVRTNVSADTSDVYNENFIKSISPATIKHKQFIEDMNNNNIDANEVQTKVDVNKNMLIDSGNTNLISEAKEFETQHKKNFETFVDMKGNDVKDNVENNMPVISVEGNQVTKASSKSTTISETSIKTEKPTQKRTRQGCRRSQPDADGRYPCKTCGRRFKRPYLYVHQKQVHQPRQWMRAPKLDPTLKRYKCGLCNLVSIYWRTMVHHHYKKHPDMEFSVFPILPGSSTDSSSLKF